MRLFKNIKGNVQLFVEGEQARQWSKISLHRAMKSQLAEENFGENEIPLSDNLFWHEPENEKALRLFMAYLLPIILKKKRFC